MSALRTVTPKLAPYILPRVWATASLAAAAAAVHERKGPHRMTLVQAHAAAAVLELPLPTAERSPEAGLPFYRKYTEALLRRYMKMSMEAGRVPSLLGREMFRGNVTSCKVKGFDDAVIFVHDVGRSLEELDAGLQHLLRRIALEEYTLAETAAMLGLHMKTVARRYGDALDKLTRLLLDRKLLQPFAGGLERS